MIRCINASNSFGGGKAGLDDIILNTGLSHVSNNSYYRHENIVSEIINSQTNENVKNTRKDILENNSHIDISTDGNWMTRGHNSNNR